MKTINRWFWLCAGITLINVFTSAGFSVAALLYSNRVRKLVMSTRLIMVMIQAGDAVIGILIHDPMKTYGPAFFSVITLAGLLGLYRATTTAPAINAACNDQRLSSPVLRQAGQPLVVAGYSSLRPAAYYR